MAVLAVSGSLLAEEKDSETLLKELLKEIEKSELEIQKTKREIEALNRLTQGIWLPKGPLPRGWQVQMSMDNRRSSCRSSKRRKRGDSVAVTW